MYKVYYGANIKRFADLDDAKMFVDKVIEDIEASAGFKFYEIFAKDSEGNIVYRCSTFGTLTA